MRRARGGRWSSGAPGREGSGSPGRPRGVSRDGSPGVFPGNGSFRHVVISRSRGSALPPAAGSLSKPDRGTISAGPRTPHQPICVHTGRSVFFRAMQRIPDIPLWTPGDRSGGRVPRSASGRPGANLARDRLRRQCRSDSADSGPVHRPRRGARNPGAGAAPESIREDSAAVLRSAVCPMRTPDTGRRRNARRGDRHLIDAGRRRGCAGAGGGTTRRTNATVCCI